jgi:hypothetical protein
LIWHERYWVGPKPKGLGLLDNALQTGTEFATVVLSQNLSSLYILYDYSEV